MIKDKNSLNEMYKNYAFVEFFELEDAKKALQAINKGEISLREEILSGNYSTKTEDKNNNEHSNCLNNYHVNIIFIYTYFFKFQNDKIKDINLNYLDNEQKQKMATILNLQNNIEASKEKQEERISSYDNYLNNNIKNKAEEELKMQKLVLIKKQRDKKKKLEKKMSAWAQKQEKISEEQIKNYDKSKNTIYNDNKKESEEDNYHNYNEEFDISKYNVISLDNMKNSEDDNKNTNNDKNDIKKKDNISDIKNEIICLICQRKFASPEKLALHEKLSDLHKKNLNKLKLNNNN